MAPCSCTVHLQYVPFWALLGLALMIAGCAVFSIAVSAHALPCSLVDPDQALLCIKRMILQNPEARELCSRLQQ